MLAKYENRLAQSNEKVWVARYVNLNNLLHWHHEYELIRVVSGTAVIMINRVTYDAKAGDTFLCEGDLFHYIHSAPECVIDVMIIDQKPLSAFLNRSLTGAKLSRDYGVDRIFQEVKNELNEKKPYYSTAIELIISRLIVEIYRNETTAAGTGTDDHYHLYAKLLEKIDREYATVSFEEAADYLCYSTAYFSKTFKKLSGITFTEYLNVIRIENAILMLHEEDADRRKSIAGIASACGFSTIRNFNRVFKSITGYTPKDLPERFILDQEIRVQTASGFDPTASDSRRIE